MKTALGPEGIKKAIKEAKKEVTIYITTYINMYIAEIVMYIALPPFSVGEPYYNML